jgi:hypothetical protein
MGYTIHLDDDFVGAEELRLLKTKHDILEKLRVRFAEMAKSPQVAAPKTSTSRAFPHQRAEQPHASR